MASLLYDLVKPYAEQLLNGVIAEARHVFCFTCIVKEFEGERANLEADRKTMVQRVKEAKERDKDILANVGSWLVEVDELNKVDTKTKQTCFLGFCPNCIWRYKKGKELANNLGKIKQLTGKKFENIELPRRVPGVERSSSENYIVFKTREEKHKELSDALKDDNHYIIGLQGMGGTGKTTLAIKVGKELQQSEQFAYVIVTTVSFTPDIKKIQDDIAGPLGLKWEGCNESDRSNKLWSRLTNGDKILVILDDVWDLDPPLDFYAIGIPKQDNHKGCRVLVTSRSLKTFNMFNCEKIIQLDLLSEEEAWHMFKIYAKIRDDSTPKKLIDKGREIANECKGLPIAISAIASSLKDQQTREHEWDVTLKSLKKPVSIHGVDKNMAKIYNCLKTSYHNLMDEKLKGLFLLCSVFREDEQISIEVLTRLCIGVGLFGEDYGSYNDAREEVVVAKHNLEDSCLLLKVDEELLRMHDLVRDAAQWIANKKIQCVNLFDKKQKSLVENQTSIKYLLCEGKFVDLFNLKLDGSKLKILIVKVDAGNDQERIEVPNSFFENVIKLRVLCFSINWDRAFSLPCSIRLLTNIRSMSFESVDLGDISILGNLQSLETLDLVKCKIDELPNQITELRKFRLLKLEWCEIRKNNPFEVIKGCSSLEELYLERSFNDFCHEITIPELQRYHINKDVYDVNKERAKYSKRVLFCGDEDEECQFSQETLKYCMQTAEDLCLERIKGEWRNIMPKIVPVERGMNDLNELRLSEISQLRCLIDTTGCSQAPNVLSKLVVLKLKDMENLEELFNGTLSLESLSNLGKLSIKDCENLQSLFKGKLLCNLKSITIKSCPLLVSLFEVSTSQSLVLLETLKISKCEGLETIISREDEEIDVSGNNKSIASVFSKLKYIRIKKCHRLESILPFLSAHDLPALETIRITKCDELKYVFGQSQHAELVSLSELELSKLPKFIGIFEECYDPMSSCVKGPSSTSNNKSIASVFSKLKYIHIKKCHQFESILPFLSAQDLPALETIRIRKCDGLKYVFSQSQHVELVSLSELDLCELPNLIGIFEESYFDAMFSCVKGSSSTSNNYSVATESNSLRVQCLPIQSKILCNIKNITLNQLPKLKSVFILSIAPIMQLENLIIRNCNELKHIIIDTGDHNTGGNNCINVFPKLKELYVKDCEQLEYIFGHDTSDHQNHMEIQLCLPELKMLHVEDCEQLEYIFGHDTSDHQNHMEIQLHLPKLRDIILAGLPSLIAMCSKQYRTTFPSLERLYLSKNTIIKELSGNVDHFRSLYSLSVYNNSKVENIFSLNEIDGQLDLSLQDIHLDDLPMMTCFCVGPKNSFAFKNLERIEIVRCDKLKIAFSTSILRFLPQLLYFGIEECKELEHIIEDDDDLENKKNTNSLSSRTCFPKLQGLSVIKCNKLKSVFPFSVCKDLPELRIILITEANELEEIFKIEDDHKVHIPNLNILAFDMLPSLCRAQGNQFQDVKNRFVRNCKKLTLTSASTTNTFVEINELPSTIDYEFRGIVPVLFKQLPSSETTEHFDAGIGAQATLEHKSDSASVENVGIEQLPSAETTQDSELPNVENVPSLTILPTNSELKGSTSEKTPVATLSTISETKNEPPIQAVAPKQKGIEIEGTSKTNDQGEPSEKVEDLAILPTNSGELLNEESLGETVTTVKPSSQLEGSTSEKTPVATVSTNSRTKNEPPKQLVALKRKNIEIEETSKTNNDQGDPFLVKRELEKLVSKNHLDDEHLSLLTDFLVKNPSVRLKDTSLPNRYKGCAYSLLAELLKFLETHSLLEVSGSCHSEFAELLQDARYFAFNKEWLDGVESRVLLSEIQVSPDALEKLLDSKKRVTEKVDDLRFKIDILSQHVEDLKLQLTSSEAELESIIQQEAVLSAPIGY